MHRLTLGLSLALSSVGCAVKAPQAMPAPVSSCAKAPAPSLDQDLAHMRSEVSKFCRMSFDESNKAKIHMECDKDGSIMICDSDSNGDSFTITCSKR